MQDGSERVVGFLTGRDMLRTVVTKGKLSEYGTEPEGWNVPVSSVMTPATELIFLSPTDTLDDARSLMAVSGKRHMPVLSGETLMGIINPKDIASYLHHHVLGESSAKEDYVSRVMPRRGMPTGVRVNRADAQPFALQSAVCNLPHPSKVEAGGEDAFLLGPHMVGHSPLTPHPSPLTPTLTLTLALALALALTLTLTLTRTLTLIRRDCCVPASVSRDWFAEARGPV